MAIFESSRSDVLEMAIFWSGIPTGLGNAPAPANPSSEAVDAGISATGLPWRDGFDSVRGPVSPFMQLAEMNWCQVAALSKDTPLIFPVAAVEQHGHHLPLYTDSFLLGEIVRRVDATIGDRIVVAPLQWLGNSDHHLDFAGTISAAPRSYLDLLGGLVENALRHGFRRVVFLNGHGGNDVPGRHAIFEARQRHRTRSDLLLLFATYWNLSELPAQDAGGFKQRQMGHACEWETSMILRLNPGWVGPLGDLEPVEHRGAFEPASRAWVTQDITARGHIGEPAAATAEKGEILFRTFAEGAIRLLERVVAWDGRSWQG